MSPGDTPAGGLAPVHVLASLEVVKLRRQRADLLAHPEAIANAVEEMIRSSIRQTESGPVLSLEPTITHEILSAIEVATRPVIEAGEKPVFLTQADVRRYLKKLSDIKIPGATVLSYQELLPSLQIRPVGKVVVGKM